MLPTARISRFVWPMVLALVLNAADSLAVPPPVRFEVQSSAGRAVAERCQAVWQAKGAEMLAALLPAAFSPDTVVCLILATSVFRRVMGDRLPEWGVGAAVGTGRLIALDHSRLLATGPGAEEVFLHEMVHALLFQGSGGQTLPTWLHEGMAMRCSGEWRFSDAVSLLMEGRVPDLARLQGPFPGSAQMAQRAYQTSLLAVDRLHALYGSRVIPDLLATMSAGNSFGESFHRMTGADESAFYAGFAAAMHWRYGWLVVLTRWPSMFALLALVLLVGGGRKMWLNRRRLAAMDDEPGG